MTRLTFLTVATIGLLLISAVLVAPLIVYARSFVLAYQVVWTGGGMPPNLLALANVNGIGQLMSAVPFATAFGVSAAARFALEGKDLLTVIFAAGLSLLILAVILLKTKSDQIVVRPLI